ncbi:MAG: YggT family protein [Hyphomicrobiales bacterium]
MNALFWLIITVIDVLVWVIIIGAIMSWLILFNVVNLNNRFVYMVYDSINRLTDPMLNPIRRFLPNLGGIDISPIVLILVLLFIRNLIIFDVAPAMAPAL